MDFYIKSKEDVIKAIEEYGFLPFFSNDIKGFSIEENIDPKYYFGEIEGIWEWKGPIIQETRCAYGKFFKNKAVFISEKWFYDFANYRRDGYDFEGRFNDGKLSYNEEFLYNIISSKHSMTSKTAKALGGYTKTKEKGKDAWEPRKGFDTTINKLMMKGYIIISDFEYEVDKNGNFYGWGISRYTTPETYYKNFSKKCYKRTPKESYQRILRHLKKILPEAKEYQIKRLLG